MIVRNVLDHVTGFQWDEGNSGKNSKHDVSDWECEEVFFNLPLVVRADVAHSAAERRFYVLGQTNRGRWLFGSFTVRRDLIRPISFRDMNAREQRIYGDQKEGADVRE